MLRIGFVLALAFALTLSARAAEPASHKLWPGKAPGETKDIGPEAYQEPKKGQPELKRPNGVFPPPIV